MTVPKLHFDEHLTTQLQPNEEHDVAQKALIVDVKQPENRTEEFE